MFSENKFKTYMIDTKIGREEMTSVYRIGDFIDLCTGPHIAHTGYAKGFKLTKHSGAYWLGDSQNESLQRVYGISFQEKQQLAEYVRQ
jgi:threonyl-tRNA synthetase